jgi:predicted ATPase
MPNYILTGTPGAGKTAVLRLLEFRGYAVVDESATAVIALEQAFGQDQPWTDGGFIDKIVALQQRRQGFRRAVEGEPIFFDRAPMCTLALSEYLGFAPSRLLTDEVDRAVREEVYEPVVFFLHNLGFVRATAARRISFEESLVFERLHRQIYRRFGFELVEVPAGPLADRVTLVEQAVRSRQC